MKQVAVMHLIDALDAGGAERMAVNVVNALPRDRYVPYFCTTRRGGALESLLSPDVARLALERRHRFDVSSLLHLTRFIRERNIRLLHAHSTSLFIAIAASRLSSRAPVIWHDHYGLHSVEKRSSIIYGPAARRLSGLIAVNQDLAEWSQKKLRVPAEKIWYIPNFAASVETHGSPPDLPGQEGMRIVCVANMRPQKDHFTLLRALGIVARRMPGVHLLLLGSSTQLNYEQQVRQEVDRLGLAGNVSFLGQRSDVPAILRAVDVGVLSSASEGLPLALLEYGVAGLATVASRVGQCPDVLDEGRAGILVPAGAPEPLADAILSFLESRQLRNDLGGRLQQRVKERYSQGSVVEQICRVYDVILERVRDQLQFDQKMTWGRRPYGT